MATRLVIATPTPGTVKTAYMKGVLALVRELARKGIEAAFDTCEGSDIALQRNILASRALANDASHVFFLDSDVVVRPDLVIKMLAADKPLVGGIYPRKRLNLAAFAEHIKQGAAVREAQARALQWNRPDNGLFDMPTDAPMCRVTHLVGGAMLVRRDVLETMINRGTALRYAEPSVPVGFTNYNFFGTRPQEATKGVHPSEDVSFCLRWRLDCGGEIWAMTDLSAAFHIGDFLYGVG